MIGELPTTLEMEDGSIWNIRTDYRAVLAIFEAIGDPELPKEVKTYVMLDCLFVDFDSMPTELYAEACKKASWFLDGGILYEDHNRPKLLDWEQDESMVFSSVNRVAGREVRAMEYVHWWTFLGWFHEIGEGLLSTVITIRKKLRNNTKLEKWEQEFYRENKEMVDLKVRYSEEEEQEIRELEAKL